MKERKAGMRNGGERKSRGVGVGGRRGGVIPQMTKLSESQLYGVIEDKDVHQISK